MTYIFTKKQTFFSKNAYNTKILETIWDALPFVQPHFTRRTLYYWIFIIRGKLWPLPCHLGLNTECEDCLRMSVSASNLGLEGEEQASLDPTLSRYIQRTGSFKLLWLLIKFTGWLLLMFYPKLRKGKSNLVILQKCFSTIYWYQRITIMQIKGKTKAVAAG